MYVSDSSTQVPLIGRPFAHSLSSWQSLPVAFSASKWELNYFLSRFIRWKTPQTQEEDAEAGHVTLGLEDEIAREIL